MELIERVMRLEFEQENLKQDLKELQQLHARAMHDLGQSRQEIKNLSIQINQLIILLKGVEDDPLNPGLVKRFVAAENFIEWVKSKKTLAFGVALAVGAVGTIFWFLGDVVIRVIELKKAMGR